MPEMTVWPVSSSVRTRKVGSSSRQREEGLAQLVLVGLGLGLDGHVDDGLGELERLEQDRVARVAQGVAGGGVLQPHRGHDVAGEDGVLVLAVVGVHLQDAPHPLLAPPLVELTMVDPLARVPE